MGVVKNIFTGRQRGEWKLKEQLLCAPMNITWCHMWSQFGYGRGRLSSAMFSLPLPWSYIAAASRPYFRCAPRCSLWIANTAGVPQKTHQQRGETVWLLGSGWQEGVKTTGKVSYIRNLKSWNSRWGNIQLHGCNVTFVTLTFCFWIWFCIKWGFCRRIVGNQWRVR